MIAAALALLVVAVVVGVLMGLLSRVLNHDLGPVARALAGRIGVAVAFAVYQRIVEVRVEGLSPPEETRP